MDETHVQKAYDWFDVDVELFFFLFLLAIFFFNKLLPFTFSFKFRTTYLATDNLLAEMEKIAEVHNAIADKFENEIYKSSQLFIADKAKTRKKVIFCRKWVLTST